MHNIALEDVENPEAKSQPVNFTGISHLSEDCLPLVKIENKERKYLFSERRRQILKWSFLIIVLLCAAGAVSWIGYSIMCKLEEMKNELAENQQMMT